MTKNTGCQIREVTSSLFIASEDWSPYWAAMRIKLFLKPRTALNQGPLGVHLLSKLACFRAGT